MALRSRLPQITAALPARVDVALKAGAEAIERGAKDRVPVASGDLRDAIHVEDADDGFYVVAGDEETFYGHLVEHGVTHTAPRPFLIPAAEAARGEIVAGVAAALKGL